MNTTQALRFAAMAVVVSLSLPAFADPPGKNPGSTHPHEPLPPSNVVCTPKAGTESMQHDPKDHPMPETRGMKNMDPAMHMLDCVDPDAEAPSEKLHEHKKLGG